MMVVWALSRKTLGDDEDMDLSAFAEKSLCDGVSVFCEDPVIFPSVLVEEIIKEFKAIAGIKCEPHDNNRNTKTHHLADEEKNKFASTCLYVEKMKQIPPILEPSISNTFAGDVGEREGQSEDLEVPETPVCPAYATYIYPKRAMTKDKEFKFILNAPQAGERFQAVRIELCNDPGQACDIDSPFLFDVPKTVCRQRFAFIKLFAVPNERSTKSLTIDNIEVDSFKFPTSCACHKRATKIFERNRL